MIAKRTIVTCTQRLCKKSNPVQILACFSEGKGAFIMWGFCAYYRCFFGEENLRKIIKHCGKYLWEPKYPQKA